MSDNHIARAAGFAALISLTAGAHAAVVFKSGGVVLSTITYTGTASTVSVGQTLPTGAKAVADGSFPNVFQNVTADGNFGVTAPVTLKTFSVNRRGTAATARGSFTIPSTNFTGSFSSKSEGALNLSTDGKSLTIGGYAAAPNRLDVSNSNTPNHVDPTNPDAQTYQRAVAEIGRSGQTRVTGINAYSGDNIRAAVKAGNAYYTVGNSNNGKNTDAPVVQSTGVQLSVPGVGGDTTKVGSYSITQNGYPKADKAGKDDNFRGLTVFGNTLFTTKGSGSNGIDTVYQVGQAGTLPTGTGNTISILPGFPTGLAKTNTANFYPFGLFFANATTLYVSDEGDGTATDANAGLSKWSLAGGSWHEDYIVQAGLELGVTYGVDGLPVALDPATTGLRNISGRVNGDGTVTIFAVTATSSGNVEPGADPNRLVALTDVLAATANTGERFAVLQTAGFGEVYRGVAAVPGVPEPAAWAMLVAGFGLVGAGLRRRNRVRVTSA